MSDTYEEFKDLKNKKIDVIFFSCFDHNEGKNNHGLFQMFEFFKQHVDSKSLFVSSMQGIYKNNKDVYDISNLGENLKLAHQINSTFAMLAKHSPDLWINKFVNRQEYINHASEVLIKNLPEHKFIALADKVDIDLFVLEKVLKHFNSKVIILSAASNTWTGYCSYPDEFNCDKYKTENGCGYPCPAIKNHSEIVARNNVNDEFVAKSFDDTREFIERNKDSVLLNVGSTFSLKEANQSFLFKDIEKCLIPLKNSYADETFEVLWNKKRENRKQFLETLKNNNPNLATEKIKFIAMWSAHDIGLKRKGIDYYINSLRILKYFLKFYRFEEVLLIFSCGLGEKESVKILSEIGMPVVFTGHIEKEKYNFLLSSSDVYCSTTLSDAGPRTTFESAALATPIISFDKCNASDLINKNNGALIDTYDVKAFAEEMYRFANYKDDDKKKISENLYNDYNSLLETKKLADNWKKFLKKHEV